MRGYKDTHFHSSIGSRTILPWGSKKILSDRLKLSSKVFLSSSLTAWIFFYRECCHVQRGTEVLNIRIGEDCFSEGKEINCAVLVFLCRISRGIEMYFIFKIFLDNVFIL